MQVSALNGEVSLTKVVLSRPARVCPKRSDHRLSVTKSRSYTSVPVSDSNAAKNRMIHTLARGMTAMNETIDNLKG